MNRRQQIEESIRIYRQKILEVQRYIEQNLGQHMTVRSLSRVASFSEFHFHRIFAELTGEPLMAYVKRLRLEKSAALLLCTTESVAGIALQVGYETAESFTRAFRQLFGVTPTDYRATFKRNLALESVSSVQESQIMNKVPSGQDGVFERVQLQTLQRTPVAFVRHVGPYSQSGVAWQTLLEWLDQRNMPQSPQWAIAYDEPTITPQDKLRFDACVEVEDDFQGESGVGLQFLAAGKYAILEHCGPFQTIGSCYQEIYGNWMPFSGFQPRDYPPVLRLHTPIHQIPASGLKAQLCVPVEPLVSRRKTTIRSIK